MFVSNNIGVIADDLTGANDTALQFHECGCNTQMILELNAEIVNRDLVQCWAISTETVWPTKPKILFGLYRKP